MASIQNEIIGIIFVFVSLTISYIFNWKQIQLNSLKYQLSPWLILCTSFNGISLHIIQITINYIETILCTSKIVYMLSDLNRTPVVMAKHGGSCVHFSWISTCGRTLRDTVLHPQRQWLPTLYRISLPVYVIVTNKRLQLLTTTWYN